MGLKEKRSLQEFQNDVFPGLKAQIDESASKDVTFEIEWEQLMEDEMGHLFNEAWTDIYFKPVISALQTITQDDMGKEAIQSGLNKIVLKNASDHANPSGISFNGGTLSIDHKPFSNIGEINARTQKVQEELENNL